MRSKFLVNIYFIFFGLSSWLAINGLWVETPILVNHLSEGWNLSSYMVLVIQMANIGPFIFGLLRKKLKNHHHRLIHAALFSGLIALILLSIFWSNNIEINGRLYSIPFFILTGILALVDCLSPVLFIPYMSNFHPNYLLYYFIGQGFSGILPSFISLIQGIGGNPDCKIYSNIINGTIIQYKKSAVYHDPRFSVSVFCAILSSMVLVSWVSFTILDTRKELKIIDQAKTKDKNLNRFKLHISSHLLSQEKLQLTSLIIYFLLAIITACCALQNGILPSIQTYSALPYGNLAYHLSVKFSVIASPITSFVTYVYKRRLSLKMILFLFATEILFSLYILSSALKSPKPPLQNSFIGSFLIIISWIINGLCSSAIRSGIAYVFREKSSEKSLFWYGICTQLGSAVGSLLMFTLVNCTSLFESYKSCE